MEKEKKKRCRVEKLESVLLSLAGSIDVSCLPPTLLKLKSWKSLSYSCSASKEIKGQILKLTQQPQPQCGRYQRMRRAGARSFLPQVNFCFKALLRAFPFQTGISYEKRAA